MGKKVNIYLKSTVQRVISILYISVTVAATAAVGTVDPKEREGGK